MLDPVAAVVSYLATHQSVSTDRVFGGELPRPQVALMPRAAILVSPAGGANIGTGTLAAGDTRIDVDCFGTTRLSAWQLYLEVKGALKSVEHKVVSGAILMWAKEGSAGSSGLDPETDWPVTMSTWQVLTPQI